MGKYSPNIHAQVILQITCALLTLLLIFVLHYYLKAFLPALVLIWIDAILSVIAVLLIILYIPLWFRTAKYEVSNATITIRTGVIFRIEQNIHTDSLRFITAIHPSILSNSGMCFIILHVYGGAAMIPFLSGEDIEKIRLFLDQNVFQNIKSEVHETEPKDQL